MRSALLLIPVLFLQACKTVGTSPPLPPKIDFTDLKLETVSYEGKSSGTTHYWAAVPEWLPEEDPERYEDGTCCYVSRKSKYTVVVTVHLGHWFMSFGKYCSWEFVRVHQERADDGRYSHKARIHMWNDRNPIECEQLTPTLYDDPLFQRYAEPEWLAAEAARRAGAGAAPQQTPAQETPPPAAEVAAGAALTAPQASTGKTSLKDVAEEAGQFSGFLKALEASGGMPWLTGAGPYVVFAPTDQAYAQIPKRVKKQLAGDGYSKEEIQAFWLRHIVSGSYTFEQLAKLKSVQPVAGEALKIQVKDENLRIHRAYTTGQPLSAPNGIIIPIDKVLYD